LIGGIVIACGHFSMAFHSMPNFYGGLALIAVGTGLLKPNISAMVGQMYAEGDERRDAGFSIFYMGINLGALIAPIVCGYLGQRVDWHYGFAAAGVGMVLGLVQYLLPFSVHLDKKFARNALGIFLGLLVGWLAGLPFHHALAYAIAGAIVGNVIGFLFSKRVKSEGRGWVYIIHEHPLKGIGEKPVTKKDTDIDQLKA